MLIYSTTAEFCQGDDFIRDGVRRLLDVRTCEGEIWINRFGVRVGEKHSAVWRVLRNMPPPAEYLPTARAFVCAGTPAWLHHNADWWLRCLEHNVPIWLIGVGSMQPHADVLDRCKHLIKVATVRDHGASKMLGEAGVPCKRFLDPGFHAPYFGPRGKTIDLAFTYRLHQHVHEPCREIRDAAYVGLWHRH